MNQRPGQFRNPYLDKGVILPPISDEIVNDENLEPQMVRVRSNNNSILYIDNEIRKSGTNPVNLTLGANNTILFARKIKRFAMSGFSGDWPVPNVNPRNNVLTLEYNLAGQRATITIPEGTYLTPVALLDELIFQLNSVTGTTGLTFSYTRPMDNAGIVIQERCATLTAVGGTFRFFSDQAGQEFTSPMIERGEHLLNLSTNNTFTASKKIGTIWLRYTRFFDIESFALNQYTKNPNASNSLGATNIIARIFIDEIGQHTLTFAFQTLTWINYNTSQTLTNIDFRLVDEFGEDLYIPDCTGDGTKNNFSWIVDLQTEL